MLISDRCLYLFALSCLRGEHQEKSLMPALGKAFAAIGGHKSSLGWESLT